uniref:NIDO domain-containing protein n=1 Tax=Romanomermis culicivorax TaxID=13658 RepID=A0A915JD02_ROMCU
MQSSDQHSSIVQRLIKRQAPEKEINIQVTAPLFTARLYDYGRTEGDTLMPSALDVGQRVDLTNPITFLGEKHSEVYVLSNGAIGFSQSSRNYKPNILRTGPKLIAPLWNRNDMRKGGQIFYREASDGRIIERAKSEIRYQYEVDVKPLSVLLVTWEKVKSVSNDQNGANTVQVALIVTDNGTFANFIYKSIDWSQGAEAGFSKGDNGQYFYSLPGSGSDGIANLKETGNTGIPGEWMFQIDQPDRIMRCKPGTKGDTCDGGAKIFTLTELKHVEPYKNYEQERKK